jgi:protein SCO1/2
MLRNRQVLVPYLLLVAALAGGILWYQSERVPRLGQTVSEGRMDVGGPFRLMDQDGKPRSDADFRGKYMLIYFGYTFCPDVCPTTLAAMGQALEQIGPRRERVVPIFITIDPERDTPAVLKDYVAAFGSDFVGLTGSVEDIQKVDKAYRVYAVKKPLEKGGYGMDHSNVLYLMGPDGKIVTYYADAVTPDMLAKDLQARL